MASRGKEARCLTLAHCLVAYAPTAPETPPSTEAPTRPTFTRAHLLLQFWEETLGEVKVPNMISANGHFKPFLCLCGAAQHPSVEDQVVNDRCCGLDGLHPRLDVIQGGQV